MNWFNDRIGFGFVERESRSDVFVYFSNIEDSGFKTLENGRAMDLTVMSSKRGDKAEEVTPLQARK